MAISSVLQVLPEKDQSTIGALGLLKQAIFNAEVAKRRDALHWQGIRDQRSLWELGKVTKTCKEQVKAHKIGRAAAKKEANTAQVLVQKLQVQLAEAEQDLAMKTAKLEDADSALEAIKTQLVDIANKGNRLGKMVNSAEKLGGDEQEDQATMDIPRRLVNDALRILDEFLLDTKPL